MGTLQLSFHGPFLYRFTASHVEIYAAKCPGHTAGIFTSKNELPLTGRHRHGNDRCYRLTGPVFAPPTPLPKVHFHDPDNTILDASKGAKPAFHTAYFCLVAPLPQTVVPMLPNEVEIVDNAANPSTKPTGVLKRRATGLRFFYEADLSKNMMVSVDGSSGPAWIADFDAPSLGHAFADADIRYASVVPEQQEHQDALECFDRIAALAGLDWWACYDDKSKPHGPQPFGKTGSDCRAAILTIR
jgi:hypothetical protein